MWGWDAIAVGRGGEGRGGGNRSGEGVGTWVERGCQQMVQKIFNKQYITLFCASGLPPPPLHCMFTAPAPASLPLVPPRYVVKGVTTNMPHLRSCIAHPAFRSGQYDTSFIPTYYSGTSEDTGIRAQG